MLYRLLRNNKESGPYTAQQLQEMGLKPYDLLWTEGRGASWQYASEINELKSFAPTIEEQPFDRFYKRNENKSIQQETVVAEKVAEKKVKPRFRISGDKIIMVEAGNISVEEPDNIKQTTQFTMPQMTVIQDTIAAVPDWKEVYSEWQKPQAKAKEPAVVETKYVQSLDDLKKNYEEKVINKKTEKLVVASSGTKQNIMAAIALVVLAFGGFMGYKMKQKEETEVKAGKPLVERADIAGSNTASVPQTDVANNDVDDNTNQNSYGLANEPASFVKPETSAPSKNTDDNKPTNSADKKSNTNSADSKTYSFADKKKQGAAKKENTTATGSVTQTTMPATIKGDNSSVTSLPETTPAAKPAAKKKIEDYVTVKKSGGSASSVQNVRLMVENVTDFPIDLAVIDIQYYDPKGRYQKGETMYLKNINSGSNVEVRVPDSDKSKSIKYKVSLVSSEQKTLYLVAD